MQYHLENRIQYYLARMMSAQKNTEFVNSNYDDIKKVVSIWICMDAEREKDGITKYAFAPESLHGEDVQYKEFNKMEAYIIRVRESENIEKSRNKLVHMLETLLSAKKTEEVKRILEEEHSMVMSIPDTEQEVNKMCNLGEALYDRAEKKGIEQGIERTLISFIIRKMKKGKNAEEIAEDLDEEISRVVSIYNIAQKFAPEYDLDAIYMEVVNEKNIKE